MRVFNPDLIVEVTSACNRACKGCYAPNVVTKEDGSSLYKDQSNLFLDVDALKDRILSWQQSIPNMISIRGGEPTLHPYLDEVIKNLKLLSREIVVETHGRWILEKTLYSEKLLESISDQNVILKISFDSMHGLKSDDLKKITDFLDLKKIEYLVAITEFNEEEMRSTRLLCGWVAEDRIVFQKKSTRFDDLIKPSIGVISTQNELSSALNVRAEL